MLSILTNKDVFEPSYDDLKFKVRNCNYVCTKLIILSSVGKELPAKLETPVRFLGWEDPLEKGQTTHSSILGLPWWFRR